MLQKEIKQYVTACSGVDVKAVRVQVEHSTAPMKPSPYIVSELLPLVPQKEALPPSVGAATDPTEPVSPTPLHTQPLPTEAKVEEAPDDRPFHQQLFSHEDEPVTVPAPPTAEVDAGPATTETDASTSPADATVEIPVAHADNSPMDGDVPDLGNQQGESADLTGQTEEMAASDQVTAPTYPLSPSLDDALKQEWAETDQQLD